MGAVAPPPEKVTIDPRESRSPSRQAARQEASRTRSSPACHGTLRFPMSRGVRSARALQPLSQPRPLVGRRQSLRGLCPKLSGRAHREPRRYGDRPRDPLRSRPGHFRTTPSARARRRAWRECRATATPMPLLAPVIRIRLPASGCSGPPVIVAPFRHRTTRNVPRRDRRAGAGCHRRQWPRQNDATRWPRRYPDPDSGFPRGQEAELRPHSVEQRSCSVPSEPTDRRRPAWRRDRQSRSRRCSSTRSSSRETTRTVRYFPRRHPGRALSTALSSIGAFQKWVRNKEL